MLSNTAAAFRTDNRPKSAQPPTSHIGVCKRASRLRAMRTEVRRDQTQPKVERRVASTPANSAFVVRPFPLLPASTLLFNYRDRLSCTFE